MSKIWILVIIQNQWSNSSAHKTFSKTTVVKLSYNLCDSTENGKDAKFRILVFRNVLSIMIKIR